MRLIGWTLLLLVAALPAMAANKISVEELKQNVASMLSAGKDDEQISNWLKDVELTEQLPPADRKALAHSLPGPRCTEQLLYLDGRSAFLEPPAADLPSEPAPDAAAQKAILATALDFAEKSNAQSPHLTVTRLSARFQDSTVNTSSSPGLVLNANYPYAMLSDARPETVEIDNGVEKPAPLKDKNALGQQWAHLRGRSSARHQQSSSKRHRIRQNRMATLGVVRRQEIGRL